MKKLIILLICIVPFSANAARIFVISEPDSLTHIYVDTEGEIINAVSGKVSLDKPYIDKVYDGDSSIVFWVEKPQIIEGKVINFSGVTPGGFSGVRELFSFSSSAEGEVEVEFLDVTAFKNDGEGTEVRMTSKTESINLLNKASITDLESPEAFVPVIARIEEYGDKEVLLFATQDKNTGIDHYEVASTWLLSPSEGNWTVVTSPYVLERLTKFQKIYIKAEDKAGNTRVESITGEYRGIFLLILAIIFIALCLALVPYTRRRSS